jgi:hypothetical protein
MSEFKFPDEDDVKSESQQDDAVARDQTDVEIEIVDDTPSKDRGRKPLGKDVADPTDDEIENYSEKVQIRIKELTHARHDERRAKEDLLREKQEMENLLAYMSEENKKLKQTVNNGQEYVISSAKESADAQLQAARRQLKDAQESFDTDAIIAAQEALTDAKMRLQQVNNYRPTPLQEDEEPVKRQQLQQYQQPEPVADEKTLRWQARNQWYGQPGFEEYTSYALGLHHKLVNAGVDPRTSQYFEQIDARLKKTFPELFGANGDEQSEETKAPLETPRSKPSSIVAPASRSTGTKKIQLTTRQLDLARKYGLTPQQYAAEVAKLEKQNG